MASPLTWLNVLQALVFLAILLGAAYGFWRGTLPYWIGGLVKWECADSKEMTLGKLTERINETHRAATRLEERHREVSNDLHDVKSAQVDIARAVNDPTRRVPVDDLERTHFGNGGARRGDFVVDTDADEDGE